ncbi:hypothetical protein GCM10011344_05750 [Dokdonia pacifica]|uniref:Uncharacterized protein n=1 Tax=Dokdonia pacifica TaxID=1627892 RepID=A0A238ZSH6_9FLAO|nr:hypothetical protein [Dokdonia pacifica]GGG08034.1 hypothetical protein GCM10011344_05750 [Dokdonia pacifica]SNR85714.1 hypothetical protein SAMN06265376_103443 [Dokdonia pacifica]
MNTKIIYTLIIFLSLSHIGFSQVTHTTEKYYFSFQASSDLEVYDTESKRVIGYESDDKAVDTEIFFPNEVSKNYLNDLARTTEQVASMLSLKEVQTAQKLPNVVNGYYVRCSDIDEGKKIPVYAVVMYNKERNLIYEATIYCYDGDVEGGKKIAQSFTLLK